MSNIKVAQVQFNYCALCQRVGLGRAETISGEKVPFYTLNHSSVGFGMFLCVNHLIEQVKGEAEADALLLRS